MRFTESKNIDIKLEACICENHVKINLTSGSK